MAMKKSHLLLLLVAIFLVFSLASAGENQQEKNEKSISGDKRVEITGLFGGSPFGGRGGGFGGGPFGGRGGGGLGGRHRCFRCGPFGFCCGFRCCSAEEYKEYIKAQGVPHN